MTGDVFLVPASAFDAARIEFGIALILAFAVGLTQISDWIDPPEWRR